MFDCISAGRLGIGKANGFSDCELAHSAHLFACTIFRTHTHSHTHSSHTHNANSPCACHLQPTMSQSSLGMGDLALDPSHTSASAASAKRTRTSMPKSGSPGDYTGSPSPAAVADMDGGHMDASALTDFSDEEDGGEIEAKDPNAVGSFHPDRRMNVSTTTTRNSSRAMT